MSLPTMIQRFLPVTDMEIQRVDRKGRTVTAYAAVFDEEAEILDKHGHYYEKINAAGFNRTLAHGIQRVQVFYNHGYDLTGKPNMLGAVPIATPVEITVPRRGLLTVSRYNDGELADAVLAAWEGGQIKGQSFTGRVFQSREVGRNGKLPVVERMELGLKEYGPTHSPAYEGAGLVAIRSQEDLAELVRSMISEMIPGTPDGDSPGDATPNPGPGTPEDSPSGHSDRATIARKRLAAFRATELGLTRDATQE